MQCVPAQHVFMDTQSWTHCCHNQALLGLSHSSGLVWKDQLLRKREAGEVAHVSVNINSLLAVSGLDFNDSREPGQQATCEDKATTVGQLFTTWLTTFGQLFTTWFTEILEAAWPWTPAETELFRLHGNTCSV